MKTMLTILAAMLIAVFGAFGSAQAALYDQIVPVNAYISYNGFDWAWASPVSDPSYIDLSFQAAYGWRFPTLGELALAPDATMFVFAGANVPYRGTDPLSGAYNNYGDPGGDLAVAVPYFNNYFRWADWGNAPGGDLNTYPWNDVSMYVAETLMVRPSAAVPEPVSCVLMGSGLVGLWFAGRRRK